FGRLMRHRRRSHHPPRGAPRADRNRRERSNDPGAATTAWCRAPVLSEFRCGGDCLRGEAKGAHRPGDVFDLLLAEIIECDWQLVADLIADCSGDADSARVAQGLQPRGYVDAIAKNVICLDDDIADIDADAEY